MISNQSNFMFICLMYLFFLGMFFSFNSILSLWLLMEINLLSFIWILLLASNSNIDSESSCFYYFVIQSLGSGFLLFSFSESDLFGTYLSNFLFILALFMKMGLYPFSFWVFKMVETLDKWSFSFLMVTQKLPVLFFLYSGNFIGLEFFLGLIMIFSSILCWIYMYTSIKAVLVCSSMYSLYWIYFIFLSSPMGFITFMGIYFMFLILLFSNSGLKLKEFLFFSFFLGVPPLSMFFFKFVVANFLFLWSLSFSVVFIWFGVFLMMFCYVKIFFFFLLPKEDIYLSNLNNQIGFFFMLVLVYSSFFFLIY